MPDAFIVLPHPSPRNRVWHTREPWRETDFVPLLRARIRDALA